jgi:MFS family permease
MGLTGMVATFGNVLWFYFLPIYYENVFHLNPVDIGLVYALWLALTALGVAPAGALADTFGRKNIIVVSSFVSAISAFMFAFAKEFWVSALAFALQGLGQALFQVSNTLVAESIEKERRGTAFGSFMMLSQILAAFSPAIGGFILLSSNSNYFPLFFIGGALCLVAAVARFLLVKETLPKEQRQSFEGRKVSGYFSRFKLIANNRFLVTLVLIYSMYNLIADQNSYITPLYAHTSLGLDQLGTGILFSALLGAVVFSRLPFGKLSDKIGRRKTVIVSWAGEITTVFVFVLAPKGDLGIAIVGIVLWQFFGVMDGPAINAWVAEASDPRNRGFSMGMFYSTAFLATVPALVLAGYLFTISSRLPFYLNSFLGVIALLLLIFVTRTDTSLGEREKNPSVRD